jgi:hypothetical protein
MESCLTLPVPGRFTHSPLNAEEVRLLRFLHGDYLRCELIHTDLDHAPRYAALSYTWGDGTNVSHRLTNFSLNGQTLQIGENLCKALAIIGKEIRERAIYLWVDAVCINQNDLLERNSHLFRMPTIYSKAVVVAIWLGEESEDTPRAVEEINNLTNHLTDVVARASTVGLPTDDTSHISPGDPICSAAAGSQAIWNILNRPWFSRAWIAQEVTWTQERKFWCGLSWIKWEHLAAASEVAHKLSDFAVTKLDPFAILDKITKWRKENINTRRQFLNLLGELRTYDCTDPRDKIYAIAGLASDLNLRQLGPNYALSVERVYIDFAATSLLSAPPGHELDILGYVIRGSPDIEILKHIPDTLPSWVPDWRTKLSIYPFYKYRINIQNDEIQGPVYLASRETKFTGFIDEFSHLHVRGFVISSIAFLSSPSFVSETSKREPYELLAQSWVPLNYTSLHTSSTTVEQEFLQTIIANTIEGSETVSPIRQPDFDWNACGIVDAMRKATYGRRFMRTRDGYMGLVPAAARVGDVSCIFFGGQVLYVMRERERCPGTWEFLGECYVDHMMDGRVYEQYKGQVQEFIIT